MKVYRSKVTRPKLNSLMKVYRYGCRSPSLGQELLLEQLRKSHDYYNELIKIECARRKVFRDVRTKCCPEVAQCEEQLRQLQERIDGVDTEWKKARRNARKRVDVQELRDELKSLKAERKIAADQLKAARESFKADLASGDSEFQARVTAKAGALQSADKRDAGAPPGPVHVGIAKLAAWEEMLQEPWPEAWLMTARGERDSVLCQHKARSEAGVSPGTYLLVERAFQAARGSSSDPEPRRWDGSGQVGVQLIPNLTPETLLEPNRWLEIRHIDPTWRDTKRHKSRHVRIRVLSGEKNAPLWVELPVVLARPLPDDAKIKWAALVAKRVGVRTRYELQLTINSAQTSGRVGVGAVAIDIGWRRMPSGDLRVGYCYDSYGKGWSLELAAEFVQRLVYTDKLRGISDKHFDVAKRVAVGALPRVPVEIAEMCTTISHWRSHAKLAKVAYQWLRLLVPDAQVEKTWQAWKSERLELKTARQRRARRGAQKDLLVSYDDLAAWLQSRGITTDTAAWYLEWWRRKNRHLYEWECDHRRKSLAHRKQIFRNWAAKLATSYHDLYIEDFDLRGVSRRPRTEEPDDAISDAARHLRQLAAVSELRDCLIHAFGAKRTGMVKKKNPSRTTLIHHGCGHDHSGDGDFQAQAKVGVIVTCAGCGEPFDQDASAAQNLLSETFGDAPTPGTSRSGQLSDSSSNLGDAAE